MDRSELLIIFVNKVQITQKWGILVVFDAKGFAFLLSRLASIMFFSTRYFIFAKK